MSERQRKFPENTQREGERAGKGASSQASLAKGDGFPRWETPSATPGMALARWGELVTAAGSQS